MNFDYTILLEDRKTGKQFIKGFNSPYLFRQALKRYRYSKRIKVISYMKYSY